MTTSIVLDQADTTTLKAIDAAGLTGTSGKITVNPAAAASFSVGAPSTVTAGADFTITVTTLDAYGNVATGYRGTATLTSSDGPTVSPITVTFGDQDATPGVASVTAALDKAGTTTLTATAGSVTGTGESHHRQRRHIHGDSRGMDRVHRHARLWGDGGGGDLGSPGCAGSRNCARPEIDPGLIRTGPAHGWLAQHPEPAGRSPSTEPKNRLRTASRHSHIYRESVMFAFPFIAPLDRQFPGSPAALASAAVRRLEALRPRLEGLETYQLMSTFTVVLATDSGGPSGQEVSATTGDLRYCIEQADASHSATSDTIDFSSTVFGNGKTITLDSKTGPLVLDDSNPLTINGPSGDLVTVSGGNAVEVLNITGGQVNISNLVISNGKGTDGGGGIQNDGVLS